MRPKSLTGKTAEASLERAGLTCNKNAVPFDPEKPTVTSGVRLGSPAGTSRGFGVTEFRRVGELHRLLLLYTQALLTQMSQTAVCNRLHSVEQQLCRWLLLSHDRLESDELIMTQELIANMLGVRREGVSVAAHHLQNAGLIRYKRGHITIVDRVGLESRVCECYQVVKTESDRLLPYQVSPPGPGTLTDHSPNVR